MSICVYIGCHIKRKIPTYITLYAMCTHPCQWCSRVYICGSLHFCKLKNTSIPDSNFIFISLPLFECKEISLVSNQMGNIRHFFALENKCVFFHFSLKEARTDISILFVASSYFSCLDLKARVYTRTANDCTLWYENSSFGLLLYLFG